MKRWLNYFLGMDPLVGMFFVTYGQYPNAGQICARIETDGAPKYLLRYFARPGEAHPDYPENCIIADLWPVEDPQWVTLFDNRKDAETCRNRRARVMEEDATRARERERQERQKRQWQPPTPIKEMPDAG